MRGTSEVRWIALSVAVAGATLLSGCGQDPTSVEDSTLLAKRGGGGTPIVVDAADPATAPQGTVSLDVRVHGSGFEAGANVDFLLDGKATGDITTNSTTFLSETELVANIDVSYEALPTLYDLRVTGGRGRKGIGIEKFSVTGVTPQECQVDFTLTFDNSKPVHSDAGSYEHGTDRVAAFAGSGPGFRFDTNGSQKLEARNDRRRAVLDFSATGQVGLPDATDRTGIDLRFAQNADNPLNLCDMDVLPVPAVATVPIDLSFLDASGATRGLKYGGKTVASGAVCPEPEATVTRTSSDTWEVSGATACLVQDGVIQATGVAMSFSFTITAQGAVP